MIALFSTILVFFRYQTAQATIQAVVTGSGSAAPVLIESGNFACNSNRTGPVGSASYEIHFAATHISNKTISGVWDISVFEETSGHILGGEQHGTLSGGIISSTGFNLTGEETFDNVCSNPVPTSVDITGKCGPLTSRTPNVEFRAANGETGSFLATVFCTS
jgi:hypothetical protein